MNKSYFVPIVGTVYSNRNGAAYRCTGNTVYPDDVRMESTVALGEHCTTMIRLTDGWAIKAHGVHQYEDGTVEWNRSSGGIFQCASLAQCGEYCRDRGTDAVRYFSYLDRLRDSAEINMMGALPYLQKEFPELGFDRDVARTVLQAWMDSYSAYKGEAGV